MNNFRKLIIEDTLVNPRIYGNMSDLLSGLVIRWRNDAIEYAEYLKAGKRVLIDNLKNDEDMTIRLDKDARDTAPFGWE